MKADDPTTVLPLLPSLSARPSMITTPSSESSDSHPRKRMRKGTHSCLECRRRKIRCIFEPDASTCNRCIHKGQSCTQQEYGDAKAMGADKRKSVRERTSELEGMINQILTKLDTNPAATGPQDAETKAAEALRSLRTELLPTTAFGADVLAQGSTGLASPHSVKSETAHDSNRHFQNPPLLSLFDNAVLAKGTEQNDGDAREPAANLHQPVLDKNRRVSEALKSFMPSIDDLGVILTQSRQSIRIWQDAMRTCRPSAVDGFDKDVMRKTQEFIHTSLCSDNLSLVACTFACLAVTMQQLPGNFDSSRLSLPAKAETLEDYYITAVETLLASDDGLASNLEGLSALVVQSKYYVNMGKPRKGWLTIRRALNFAQMLGFHRQSYHQDDHLTMSRKSIWLIIFQIERFLSLMLGYPSACIDAHYESMLVGEKNDGSLDPQRFAVRLSIITGQIITRNQDPDKMTVAMTMKIDQDLEDTRKILSSEWWNSVPGPECGVGDVFDTFVAKSFYHNVRMLLHLPFMLKASTDRRYEYSRIAALESSREMIATYHLLRHPLEPLIVVCNVIDFQVFTGAMLLIINLLGNHDSSSGVDRASSDWDIILNLIKALDTVIEGETGRHSDGVAAQARTVLKDLVKARFCVESPPPDGTYQAVIPYFGKIRIRCGTQFRACPEMNNGNNNNSNQSQPQSSSSVATTPSLPSMGLNNNTPNTNQIPTPSDSAGTPFSNISSYNGNDPQLSFENYYQPLPGDTQPWLDGGVDWSAMNEFELLNDWNWFAGVGGGGEMGDQGLQHGGGGDGSFTSAEMPGIGSLISGNCVL
ncbi:MAG: hypothetical protein L6R41_005181 [Letrouitia leprolyta]|nr:MAG: hypothetical protein L6R41_005181 [Letrouitia leprolyta]